MEELGGVVNLAHGGVVPGRESAARAAGKNVAYDPKTMLDVIEGDESVIKGEHGIVQADFVAHPLRQALDEPHHVVRKIADGAGDNRWEAGNTHGLKAIHALPNDRNWIAFFPDDP